MKIKIVFKIITCPFLVHSNDRACIKSGHVDMEPIILSINVLIMIQYIPTYMDIGGD